ncbi:selenide, water dikinase SelD [Mesobaculum littorinae]|uniref:Selenide, water dikinase SelD n=1 Tax=Mesobaculum littorinae TaxID=2486419 RepID=A0A438ALP5_9RHOB|nr:selenide, water dikinase SelD [Mesobaculum littorinae]RVV99570.1 selenide, water dikinase SelD [Mesobaculum littorinae]
MREDFPKTRDLVLVGGGHAHALLLRRWGMDPLPGARLTLIDPAPVTSYTGMLPGFVAGHYSRATLEIDLVRLARHAGARLILGRADALEAGRVHVAGRGWVAFDVASLDIGIHGEMTGIPGFAEHGHAAKPLDRFAAAWAAHRDALGARPGLAAAGAAVIGGGVAGVELALAIAHGGERAAGRPLPVTLIDRDRALTGASPGAARALRARLAAAGITVIEGTLVAGISGDEVTLGDNRRVASAFTVAAAGARPHAWLERTGLALHEGFVAVDAQLRSLSDPQIFAAGDCAHLTHAPRPKAGVYAVRAAPVLFHNLRAALGAGRPRRFRPQARYLKLVSTGGRGAVADRGGWGTGIAAPLLWRWKDRIDRHFMERLSDLSPMPRPRVPARAAQGLAEAVGDRAPCGGCGAKVGQMTLASALGSGGVTRADVELGVGDDAAVLRMGDTRQVLTTDHLRAVTDDPYVMSRLAALHAMGDVWAMGAAPQAVLPVLTLPALSPRLQARTLTEIMAAAHEVFDAEGAQIVGGHTATGTELSIGFTVTGLLDRPAIGLAGARPGDALILTKPLGSGTILAAEMALQARGPDVAAAWAEMQRGQGAAADILGQAHAMTDVTGFGLAGHLTGMLRASGVAARIDLGAVPLMPGAAELAARGVRSTLYSANRASLPELVMPYTLPDTPAAHLLFDPQTAGGLLAAVAPETADDLLSRLGATGYPAARIGVIVAGTPELTFG